MKEKDDWLFYRPAGEYIFSETEDKRNGIYTFLPKPLTKVEVEVDEELSDLLCTANRLLGRLDGISAFLPNVSAVESILMHKEALLSCQIDGIEASLYNVLDASLKCNDKTVLINNYVSALQLGLERVKNEKYHNKLLCDIHGELTKGKENVSNGRFRDKLTIPGKTVVSTNASHIYYPTAPEHFPRALGDLENFIRRSDGFDAILKTALSFYQLETVSPFMTDNGMITRILTYLVLVDMKILRNPLTCFSHYVSLNKMEYKDRIGLLHRRRDYEQWIKFFITSVIFAADESLAMIEKWLRLREHNIKKIEASGKSIKSIMQVYDVIERFPIFDINTIAREAGVSYNTGAAIVRIFTELKITRQINKMARNRDYAYIDFLNCFFSEDMLCLSYAKNI